MNKSILLSVLLLSAITRSQAQKSSTDYVNPLLGTATSCDPKDLEVMPTHITSGAEVVLIRFQLWLIKKLAYH